MKDNIEKEKNYDSSDSDTEVNKKHLSRKERNKFVFQIFSEKISKISIRLPANNLYLTNNLLLKTENKDSIGYEEAESNFSLHLISEKALNQTQEYAALLLSLHVQESRHEA